MQHFGVCLKEVCFFLEIQPNSPMSFQGKAMGAKCITSGFQSTIREEFSKGRTTDWTFHLVTYVENSNDPQRKMAENLKVFSRNRP